MTKAAQNRLVNFRYKFLQHAKQSGNVALTCRYFGISREKFYKWKKRFDKHGTAGLCDQPRTPHHSPNETPKAVVSKILYLRQSYHFGAGKIRDYLNRFHSFVRIDEAHRIARDFWREMRVAHRHLDRRVTEQVLDGLERRTTHREVTRERVAQHVPADLAQPCLAAEPREPVARLADGEDLAGIVLNTSGCEARF